jgi:hypothetical protein
VFPTYVVVTVLAVAANGAFAVLDLARSPFVLDNMAKVNLAPEAVVPLGVLKGLGAAGLIIGFVVPVLGVAAAAGLSLFFVGAVLTHLRAREYSLHYPGLFLLLAVGSLTLRLATM